jgi:hypothetical protein
VEKEGVGPRREAAAGVLVDGRVGAPRRQVGEEYCERECERGSPVRAPHLGGRAMWRRRRSHLLSRGEGDGMLEGDSSGGGSGRRMVRLACQNHQRKRS